MKRGREAGVVGSVVVGVDEETIGTKDSGCRIIMVLLLLLIELSATTTSSEAYIFQLVLSHLPCSACCPTPSITLSKILLKRVLNEHKILRVDQMRRATTSSLYYALLLYCIFLCPIGM